MSELHPDVPVVSISASPPSRPAQLPARIGFASHLLKPLDHDKLLHCIGDLLGLDFDRLPGAPPEQKIFRPPTGARPDPAAMQILRGMIANGQMSDIMSWAETMKAAEPSFAGFADAIYFAARQLDFPTLSALAKS